MTSTPRKAEKETARRDDPAGEPGLAEMRFEAALAELEALVVSMEAGQLPLDESLAAYRRGVALLQHCQRQLADAEEKIRVLDNGVLRPFGSNDGESL